MNTLHNIQKLSLTGYLFRTNQTKTSKYLNKEKRGQFITELPPNKFLECQVITVRKQQLSG